MNQNPDEVSQTLRANQNPVPQVILPNSDPSFESMNRAVDQLESNIQNVMGDSPAAAIPPAAPGFDAVRYAQVSNQSLSASPPAEPLPGDQVTFAASDPYVNLIESTPSDAPSIDSPIPTAAEMRQSVSSNPEPDASQPAVTPAAEQALSSNAGLAGPTVEIISEVEQSQSSDETLIRGERQNAGATVDVEETSASVAWYADSSVSDVDEAAASSATLPTPESAVPLINPSTGEAVYDVRDFVSASDSVPAPIPGAFEVDPELFDFKTGDELSETTEPVTGLDQKAVAENDELGEDQLFIADVGDVIQIDGKDGYNHIDLACFNIQCASFRPNVIQIDDQQGSSFEVRHRNIEFALFANNVKIDLVPRAQ